MELPRLNFTLRNLLGGMTWLAVWFMFCGFAVRLEFFGAPQERIYLCLV